jgi:transcriptional regulator with XRE-family HTH domain
VTLVEGSFCDLRTRMEWPRTSPEGTTYWPSDERHTRATPVDLDNARTQFKERSENEWIELFDRAPHVMHAILGDIFREVRAEAEREGGHARIGRRPKAIDGTLDEMWDMVSPRYSNEPFIVAVKDLVAAAPSKRAFAIRARMDHATLLRLMSGRLLPDRHRLEQIAKAGKVAPAYFMEWRSMYVAECFISLMTQRPTISVKVYRQLRKAQEL